MTYERKEKIRKALAAAGRIRDGAELVRKAQIAADAHNHLSVAIHLMSAYAAFSEAVEVLETCEDVPSDIIARLHLRKERVKILAVAAQRKIGEPC